MDGTAAKTRTPDHLERLWAKPFRLEGESVRASHEVPQRVLEVTRRAWTALQEGGPDQLVPGFRGLGVALVLRNLPPAFGDAPHPPLVVFTSDKEATDAYHSLEVDVIGRWATTYPMFYRGPDGDKVPLNKRGLPRSQPGPRPVVHRAFDEEDLDAWADELEEANFLYVVDSPEELPSIHPENTHVIVQGLPTSTDPASGSLRTPLDVCLPVESPEQTSGQGGDDVVDRLVRREANVENPRVLVETTDSDESDLARLTELYLDMVRQESWAEHGRFLGVCKTLLERLQADVAPRTDIGADLPSASTRALIGTLGNARNVGRVPDSHHLREFLGRASRLIDRREQVAPPKSSWLASKLESYRDEEGPDLVVDASYNRERARAYLKDRLGHPGTKVLIETVKERKEPGRRPILVTMAPTPRLLQELVSGRAPLVGFLLYPWEVPRYAAARRTLLDAAEGLGVEEWPQLPPPPDANVDLDDDHDPILVAKSRTDPANVEAASTEKVEEELPAPAEETEPEDQVVLETPTGSHAFPSERKVMVKRGDAFHELPAEDVEEDDVIVLPADGGEASAHEVVLRICRQNSTMEKIRSMANMWRQELKNHYAENYADSSIRQMHDDLDPGVGYQQFRKWLRENDPVKPERENLRNIMKTLGESEELADLIYARGLNHLAHRRQIREHLLHLSKGHLHKLYRADAGDETVDADVRVSLEDLQSIVTFERIEEVREND